MPAPTVEMGLGGSLRSLAAGNASTGGFYSMMNAPAYYEFVTPSGTFATADTPLFFGVADSWLEQMFTLPGSAGVTLNVPSELPEGGVGVSIDGVDDYLSVTVGAMGILPSTLEAVVSISSTPGVGVEPLIWGGPDFGMTYRNDGRVYVYYDGSSVTSAAVSTGQVVHLAITRAGTSTDTVKLYVNGAATTVTPARASLADTTMWCGKHWTDAEFLHASVYYVALFASELSAADIAAHAAAATWTDVTTDTLGARPLVIERGIRDDKPSSRVASTGTCAFSLNNLASNSGGLTGYYSPGNASCRVGFAKGTPVRVKTGSDVQFLGRIRSIAPEPGRNGVASKVFCTDFMDTAATFLLENAPILEGVTGDAVFAQVVGLIPNQPAGITTYTGSETYTLALDNTRDEAVSALQEFHRLAVSELGYIYVTRQGALVYEARGTRITNAVSATITIDDTMHGLDVAEVSSSSLNRVQVTVHPRDIDAAATTVLFELTNALEIGPGETKTILGPYRTASSPGITTRVGGLNMVTPAATTDYTMNVLADGAGADLTASLDVTASYGANGVKFTLVSAATETAYITKLQCRGKGVYDFRTVVLRSQDDAAIASDGVNALNLDMVYQENPNVGQAVADSLRTSYGDLSGTRARSVWVYPDAAGSPAGITTADISTRVAVSESRTGATGDYYINGVKHEYKNGTLPKVTWWLAPAEPVAYWILGLAGASELGSTTVLAPG